jgi:hypothetical protein
MTKQISPNIRQPLESKLEMRWLEPDTARSGPIGHGTGGPVATT